MLSRHLEQTLDRALAHANARHHEFATLEHLLLALTDDEEAVAVMRACNVDIDLLRRDIAHYVDTELQDIVRPPSREDSKEAKGSSGILRKLAGRRNPEENLDPSSEESKPTSSFQRVLQRAVTHVQSSGREEVTSANVLVELFRERESSAVYFLHEQEMTRFDAVIYISHGILKAPGQKQSSMADEAKDAASPSRVVEMLNDDYTPMDFVVQVLQGFFDKSRQEANELMLQIHRMGKAICGSYPCALAAAKANMVMDYARKNEHPLRCAVVKEG